MANKQQRLIQQLLATVDNPSELLGEGGLFKQLKKAMMEFVGWIQQNNTSARMCSRPLRPRGSFKWDKSAKSRSYPFIIQLHCLAGSASSGIQRIASGSFRQ